MFKCFNLFPWRGSRQLDCIDKRHCNLASVPDEVLRQERSLEELYLSANQLKELPKVFCPQIDLRFSYLFDQPICWFNDLDKNSTL